MERPIILAQRAVGGQIENLVDNFVDTRGAGIGEPSLLVALHKESGKESLVTQQVAHVLTKVRENLRATVCRIVL
jgi:hypothetical protein